MKGGKGILIKETRRGGGGEEGEGGMMGIGGKRRMRGMEDAKTCFIMSNLL